VVNWRRRWMDAGTAANRRAVQPRIKDENAWLTSLVAAQNESILQTMETRLREERGVRVSMSISLSTGRLIIFIVRDIID
jgi:hypothetical protein